MSDREPFDHDPLLWAACAELSAIHHGIEFSDQYVERYKAGGEFEAWEWDHWRYVIAFLLPVDVAALSWPDDVEGVEAVRRVGLLVECPHHRTGPLVRFGLDRDPVLYDQQRYDTAWMQSGGRVPLNTKVRGDSEFTQFGDHRLDIRCPVPRCRYHLSATVPTIVVQLHRMRHALRDDPRPVIELAYRS